MKILKIKMGEVFIDNKNHPVFMEAWPKQSKDKKTTYYQIQLPIFIQEIKDKPKEEKVTDL